MTTASCHIIGILDSGLASLATEAREQIAQAELVIGVARTLGLMRDGVGGQTELRPMDGQLSAVAGWCAEALAAGRRVVVLASGDPLCHGIAPLLLKQLPAGRCVVIPNLSTLQLAAARAGIAWQGFQICSIHSRDAGEWHLGASPGHGLYSLMQQINHGQSLAILTSPANGPDRIARMMLLQGCEAGWQMVVAERLQQPQERVMGPLTMAEAAERLFAALNVVLLWRDGLPPRRPRLGIPDQQFAQRRPEKGLITKREVRAVSLAALQLKRDSVVWDIGAGSGSVGLEAALLSSQGHVYALEKNGADLANIEANRHRLQLSNYTALHAKAPQGLDTLPDPDAVFIGGSGGNLALLIDLVLQRLRPQGWLVINLVTLENLHTATESLKQLGAQWELSQVTIARSQPILNMQRLSAENPVWVVAATNPPQPPFYKGG